MKIDMFQDGEGWMVTRLHAEEEGTEPGAEIIVRVNVGHPNSYPEYTTLAQVFTTDFLDHMNKMSDDLIRRLIAENPDVAEDASNDIFEAARLAGFSAEDAQDMASIVLAPEGEAAG